MRKGYQNLLETLRLLNVTEDDKSIEWVELQTATGKAFRCAEIKVDGVEVFGRIWSEHTWIQLPSDELVALTVEFGPTATSRDLPTALANARKRTKTRASIAA